MNKWLLYPLCVTIYSSCHHVFSDFATCCSLVNQITLSNFFKFFLETIFVLLKTPKIRCQNSILWKLPENKTKTKPTTRSQTTSLPHDTIHVIP